MIQLIFLMMVGVDPATSVLEFSGNKGVEFFGICISKETGQEKRIEGVAPAKIYLDANIQKCSIKKKGAKGTLKVRLFHNKELLTDRSLSEPTSGIELVIPFF